MSYPRQASFSENSDIAARSQKLDAFAVVFQKVCRIMSGKMVEVKWVLTNDPSLANVAGWTDGKTVSLNRRRVGEEVITAKSHRELVRLMASTTGVIYHELSHVIYTPRNDEAGMPGIIKEANIKGDFFFQCWNVLEDQRIEYLFSASYTPVEKYFNLMALEWVLGNTKELGRAYPMLYGRAYLPFELREESRRQFVESNDERTAQEAEKIIDAYMKLNVWDKPIQQLGLVRKFWKLLTTLPSAVDYQNNGLPNHTGGHDKVPDRTDASARKEKRAKELGAKKEPSKNAIEAKEKEETKEAIRKAKRRDEEEYETIEADAEGEEADSPAGDSGSNDGDGDGDGESDGDGEDGEGEADKASDATNSSQGVGNSKQEGKTQAVDHIAIAEQAIEELFKDDELLGEVNETINAATAAAKGDYISQASPNDFINAPVDGGLMVARNAGSDILRTIKTELEPTWEHGSYTGRLDMTAVMARQVDPSRINVFDQWDEGMEEEVGLELCIALDISGSMSGYHQSGKSNLQNACEAMWAIRSMCELVEIPCTVFGFGVGCSLLFGPNDRTEKGKYRMFRTHSSTNPVGAIIESRRIFAASQKPNKVFVAITDGSWGMEGGSSDVQISAMNKDGVLTCMLNLGGQHGRHQCKMFHVLQDSSVVTKFIKELVIAVTRQAAGRS